jgi:hypothetical protein
MSMGLSKEGFYLVMLMISMDLLTGHSISTWQDETIF